MYRVMLSACGNIDHGENPYSNVVGGRRVNSVYVECNSIEECQKVVLDYIDRNFLGAGNWSGGVVYRGNERVGRISYNGRYWKD